MEPAAELRVEGSMVRRIWLHVLFAATVLVTLALSVLAVRSFWISDGVYWPAHELFTYRGYFIGLGDYQRPLGWFWYSSPVDKVIPIMFKPTWTADYFLWEHNALVGRPFISSFRDPTGKDIRVLEEHVIVAGWVPILFFAAMSGLLFLPIYRNRRRVRWAREGRCRKCGYDVRAQREGKGGDKCPECGSAVESVKM